MIKIPVGPRAYLCGRRAVGAGSGAALRSGNGAATIAGEYVVETAKGELRRAVRLRSVLAEQVGEGEGVAVASGSISIDRDGFHEIRESVEQSVMHARDSQSSMSETKAAAIMPKEARVRRTKADVMARLDELARLEAEAAAETPTKRSRVDADHSLEIAALNKRMKEIKSVDDYDEDDALMSELKELRARLRKLKATPPSSTLAVESQSSSSSTPSKQIRCATAPGPPEKLTTLPPPPLSTNFNVISLKEAGNAAFKDKDYGTAISKYTEALMLVKQGTSGEEHLLLSNRSLCFCKARFYREAERDARRIVQCKPEWAKGYYRLASAMLDGLNENGLVPSDILGVLKEGLEVDAKNKGLRSLQKKVLAMVSSGKNEKKTNEGEKAAGAGAPAPASLANDNTAAFSGRILERGVRANASVSESVDIRPGSNKNMPNSLGKPMSAFMRRRLGIAEEEEEPVARLKAVSRPYF